MSTDIPTITGPGNFDIEVVGEGYYQEQFLKFCGPKCAKGFDLEVRVHLYLEPDNKFDDKAVAVLLDGEKVGYLPRETARDFRRAAVRGDLAEYQRFECMGHIRGGWDKGGGDTGHFGIWLDLPEDE